MNLLYHLRTLWSAKFFIYITLIFLSCKKEDSIIGVDIQPENESSSTLVTDTLTIESYTVKDDSVISNNILYCLLGSMNDSVFGKSHASFYTQLTLPTTNINFGNPQNISVDSVVLSLKYANNYGISSALTFKVFELDENLDAGKNYYSNLNLSVLSNPLGSLENHTADLLNPVYLADDTLAPQLRIKLANSLGEKFIDAPGSTYTSNENFRSFFKGLYVTVENSNQPVGQGNILSLDLLSLNSKVTIYYTEGSVKKSFDFIVGQSAVRINRFNHDYAGTPVEKQLASSESSQNNIYVQSMSGIKTKIRFPYLKNLKSLKNIAINKAELIIPADQPNSLWPHAKLSLAQIDDNGNSLKLPDANEGDNYFGGYYNDADKEYRFNLARYTQQIINGSINNNGLYLLPVAGVVTANQTRLKGGYPLNTMKLKITYTKI